MSGSGPAPPPCQGRRRWWEGAAPIALTNFREAEQQLQVAQALGQTEREGHPHVMGLEGGGVSCKGPLMRWGRHIARMDLDKAKEMHFETPGPLLPFFG